MWSDADTWQVSKGSDTLEAGDSKSGPTYVLLAKEGCNFNGVMTFHLLLLPEDALNAASDRSPDMQPVDLTKTSCHG